MRRRLPTLQDVRRLTRARICARCACRSRGGGRDCEARCPLFQSLPTLWNAARLIDPMLTDPRRMLQRRVRELSRPGGRNSAAMRRHGDDLVDLLCELIS